MQYIRPSHNTSPSQHVPRGGAAGGPRAAPASSWHVREDGGCGPRGPDSPGTSPAGGAEDQVHAVEGDAELHVDSGFPHRRIPGRLQSSGQRKSCQVTEFSSSNSCSFCIMMLKSVFLPVQKSSGECHTNFKRTKSRDQVTEAFDSFVESNTHIVVSVRFADVSLATHRLFLFPLL